MRMAMNSLEDVVCKIRDHDDFIIVGHERPDPDSLGSMLGLYFGLSKLGKHCRLVSADPIPPYLSWPGLEKVEVISEDFQAGTSCVIVVDCEPARTGSINAGVQAAKSLINIDHHLRDRGLGDVVYVDPSEAATSVIIYRLLLALEVPFDQEIATVLYGGIVGDTGGFRFGNTTSEVLSIASELLQYGVEPARVAQEIFSMFPIGFLRLLGHALSSLGTALDGKIAWIAVSHGDFLRFDVDPNNADQLVNFARSLDTCEIAMVFREISPGEIRLGLRAHHVDVGALARHFGGGGHKLASGATLQGDLQQVSQEVVKTAQHYLLTGEIDGRNN